MDPSAPTLTVVVGGATLGGDFPTTPGSLQPTSEGGEEGIVVSVSVDTYTAPFPYCTAKTSLVCGLPAIGSSGVPSAAASSGFEVFAGPARQNRSGLLLYADAGPAAIPFQGGLLCIQPSPLKRTAAVLSGGTGACNGEFRLDMNAFAQGGLGGNPEPFLLVPGTAINVQWWGRDSVATGSFLSDALEYQVCK